MTERVFICYARRDAGFIRGLVRILRALRLEVFRDEESIEPGARWRDILNESLDSATTVLVFWSKRAASSKWVAGEVARAVELGKRLIPIILDDTPLGGALAERQWIDLRDVPRTSTTARTLTLSLVPLLLFGLAVVWVTAADVDDHRGRADVGVLVASDGGKGPKGLDAGAWRPDGAPVADAGTSADAGELVVSNQESGGWWWAFPALVLGAIAVAAWSCSAQREAAQRVSDEVARLIS